MENDGIGIPSGMHFEVNKPLEYKTDRQFDNSLFESYISSISTKIIGESNVLNSEHGNGSMGNLNILYNNFLFADTKEEQDMLKIKSELNESNIVVIAEDEDLNFMLLHEMLSDTKLTIIRALNGQEAVDICNSKQPIDLVLMDIRMPIMNGYEATERIKGIRPNLPIIVQTSYSTGADREKAFASGCSDFINKPINRNLLILKINEHLNCKI